MAYAFKLYCALTRVVGINLPTFVERVSLATTTLEDGSCRRD